MVCYGLSYISTEGIAEVTKLPCTAHDVIFMIYVESCETSF